MADDADHWLGLVSSVLMRKALGSPASFVQALTPVRPLGGMSRPVVVDCNDGGRYVLKGQQVMRSLVADYVVGRLAAIIEAPVPRVELVDVPQELIAPSSFLEHFQAGIAHGSEFTPGCADSFYIQHVDEPANAERFALLAVLYGWTDPEDRQYLYKKDAPHLVYSVDHGAFFTGSSDWTIESLSLSTSAKVDQLIAVQAGLRQRMLRSAVDRLAAATDEVIAEIVATPPAEWGISVDERVALAQYLASRRDFLLNASSAC